MISQDHHRAAHPDVRVIHSVAELRDELDRFRMASLSASIGLVPTMGALHEGHLSLIDRSDAECDLTVVSIFVNPTQFRPGEDLDRYPRQLQADIELAAARGADVIFAPSASEVYPDGFATNIAIRGITDTLCGAAHRRGHEHFDGVATVVAKLFNMVQPDRAYFGQKDAQQVAVIKRLVRDLDFRVEVVPCPTVREADGLAMSSRNVYLSPKQRSRALGLFAALAAARDLLANGETSAAALTGVARDALSGIDSVEYFELVDPDTLAPVSRIDRPVLAVIAARVGDTRLIDNLLLDPTATPHGSAAGDSDAGDISITTQIPLTTQTPQGAVI
ncbi:MAG: pantoate--beta-alanine ligase [Solirubrobacterales bacterium]